MANTQDKDWDKNKAIGNITENLVEYLINSTGEWRCIKLGMENHINELKNTLKDNLTETSRTIRSMPDFIIVNNKTGEVMLIDVKYRSFIDKRNPPNLLYGFSYGRIKDYLDFWKDIKLLIVHPHEPYLIVVDMKDVEWHKHFDRRTYLDNGKMFEQWNFAGIQKDIKSLFPNLSDEIIKNAIDMIPNRDNGNNSS